MKNIVITSNPFGYGPTGQAITLIQELLKNENFKSARIYFLGSSLCREIIEKELQESSIIISDINERNTTDLEHYINNIQGDIICIGFQNRFIIEVSKKLGIKSIFIDGLGWFWDITPTSHLLADKIYWTNFPNLSSKEKIIPPSVAVIGLMQEICVHKEDFNNPFCLVSLGGCINPLTTGLQENYLLLTIKVFENVYKKINIPIKIALGSFAKKFLETNTIIPTGITIHSFDHKTMLMEFSHCHHHFSIGGQSSTMEALQSSIPTTFYLPSNLSQIAFQDIFEKHLPGNFYSQWSIFLGNEASFSIDNEAKAIADIDNISKKILTNNLLINKIADNLIKGFNNKDKNKLFDIVKSLGSTGAQQITSDIINW